MMSGVLLQSGMPAAADDRPRVVTVNYALSYFAERLGADAVSVGALVSIFAAAQLASSPLWGRLSDRYGRRPMILGGLVISAISYLLFESATTVWLLFLSSLGRFVPPSPVLSG